ncbi:hypothetical protein [Hwangdonia seohaensis]|uniref:Uncharacterized protein n=1 Tax=Hwangdonia seohaensis TaxID=1240727 RepID=A0ABW3RA31_9FLAO|nr:hypothetical protein [Hwangdonia seohaensis]
MTNLKFRYTLTILNTSVFIGELIVIVFTIFKWDELSRGEGWGVVYMIGFGVFIAAGLLVDLILQITLKHRPLLNGVGLFVVLVYLYMIFLGDL